MKVPAKKPIVETKAATNEETKADGLDEAGVSDVPDDLKALGTVNKGSEDSKIDESGGLDADGDVPDDLQALGTVNKGSEDSKTDDAGGLDEEDGVPDELKGLGPVKTTKD